MLTFASAVYHLPGIGPKIADKLAAIGVTTVRDLAYYFPRAWEDLSRVSPIDSLLPDGRYTIRGNLIETKAFRSPHKRIHITQATFEDSTGRASAVWFNQPYLAKSLNTGKSYYLTGKVEINRNGATFVSPTHEEAILTPIHSGRIIPIYPETLGLTTKLFRRIMIRVRPTLNQVTDPLPQSLLENYDLAPLNKSLTQIHFPENLEDLQAAKDRLGFDELLITQLAVGQMKRYLKTRAALPIPLDIKYIKHTLTHLPFTLTAGQKRALWEILQDLAKPEPTNRMLEGDVGSGKTIIAAISMSAAAHQGFTSCLMAPTEVLALQHYQKLLPLFQKMGFPVRLHTRNYQEGPDDSLIVIGTHSLIQADSQLPNLNLVIVDEQHRFGVKQREALKQKGRSPHFISLTATPIPRSLALTIFGDLDLSIIKSLPQGRQPIETSVVVDQNRGQVWSLIKEQVTKGHQVYIVVPVINEDNRLNLKSAETAFKNIQKIFPGTTVGLLHGRLRSEEKAQVLQDFNANKTSILVATTVVEVGIDVPNATVMVIEQAERFGLAQLHQLRGRVGRGSAKSYCLVIPESNDSAVLERLSDFANTLDGFKLAELDLRLRGPGSLFGANQSGFLNYRLANWTDARAIKRAQDAASLLLDASPDLSAYPELAQKVELINVVSHNE